MRIAVDVMGGEKAPEAIVQGAIESVEEKGLEVILVGDEERIKEELKKYSFDHSKVSLKHAGEVVGMEESPVEAWRKKKNSSIVKAVELLKEEKAEALVSAGSTGVAVTARLMELGRLEGVIRPAIAALMPTLGGVSVLLDVGSNVDCKPKHLLQFAIMGDVYARHILKKSNPRVGLLSVGREKHKGNELTKETHELLKETSLNFMGNVEGGDIVNGEADVIVCDGFVGKVIIKVSESVAHTIGHLLNGEISKGLLPRLGAHLIKSRYKEFWKRVDYAEYGGAPLLGVKGVGIIAHGASSSKAIKNAVRVAKEFVGYQVNKHIVESLKNYA